ncbi:hypothetical protein DN730_08545 [Marinomonas piezotolerans]|uniref:DUF3329 domain-containing protein n=1 Tax=Marinomonas piezotolerans TaxID=2213058 RepID=A0A370U9H3_9GAMM|nr:hypothetical protein [Marinomonas piezotolerans]RDL44437.1 hypothetical protein DN730_08545 [Marinomonas piezotolerans]
MSDSEQEFFRPKWRRIAVTAFCAGWALLEWFTGNPMWSVIFAAMTGYCLWKYWFTFDDTPPSQ